MKGDSGVAGEGRVVGIPKFHYWGKFTMPLTNINSDRMSTLPLACVLFILNYIFILYIYIIYLYYAGPLGCILGCNDWINILFLQPLTLRG